MQVKFCKSLIINYLHLILQKKEIVHSNFLIKRFALQIPLVTFTKNIHFLFI